MRKKSGIFTIVLSVVVEFTVIGSIVGQDAPDTSCRLRGTEYSCSLGDVFPTFGDILESERLAITTIKINNATKGHETTILDGAISDFPALEVLDLKDINLQSFLVSIFNFVPNLSYINLSGNGDLSCSGLEWLKTWILVDDGGRQVIGECRTRNNFKVNIDAFLADISADQHTLQFNATTYDLLGKTEAILLFSRIGDIRSPLTIRVLADAGLEVDPVDTVVPVDIIAPSVESSGAVTVTVLDEQNSGNFTVRLVASSPVFTTTHSVVIYVPSSSPTTTPVIWTTLPDDGTRSSPSKTKESSETPAEGATPAKRPSSSISEECPGVTTNTSPKRGRFPWWLLIVIVLAIVGIIIIALVCKKISQDKGRYKSVKYAKPDQSEDGGSDKKVFSNTTENNL